MLKTVDFNDYRSNVLYVFSIILWILLIIVNGTYIRPRDYYTSPTIDWVVVVRIILSVTGLMTGIILWKKSGSRIGWGSKLLLVYAFSAMVSSITSHYLKTALGYSFLFSCAVILTIGITQASRNISDFSRLETIWLIVIIILVIKDSILSMLMPDEETHRLGMGISHANTLGSFSVLAFWLLYWRKRDQLLMRFASYGLLLILAIILVLTGSRTSIIALLGSGLVTLWFSFQNNIHLRRILFFGLITLTVFIVLLFALQIPFVDNTSRAFNRNQTKKEMVSFTGRSQIWHYVLGKIVSSPKSLLFGYGYGTTREMMLEDLNGGKIDYAAGESHNLFLEFELSMGTLGFLICFLLFSSNARWFLNFNTLRQYFGPFVPIRAIAVISAIAIISLQEAPLCGRVFPELLLFMLYTANYDGIKQAII